MPTITPQPLFAFPVGFITHRGLVPYSQGISGEWGSFRDLGGNVLPKVFPGIQQIKGLYTTQLFSALKITFYRLKLTVSLRRFQRLYIFLNRSTKCHDILKIFK